MEFNQLPEGVEKVHYVRIKISRWRKFELILDTPNQYDYVAMNAFADSQFENQLQRGRSYVH